VCGWSRANPRLTLPKRVSTPRPALQGSTRFTWCRVDLDRGDNPLGSVIKKRRKKMRKHKQRKLLKRQRHKK
jgi:hypothetical protein